jgi:hypothetical protein
MKPCSSSSCADGGPNWLPPQRVRSVPGAFNAVQVCVAFESYDEAPSHHHLPVRKRSTTTPSNGHARQCATAFRPSVTTH